VHLAEVRASEEGSSRDAVHSIGVSVSDEGSGRESRITADGFGDDEVFRDVHLGEDVADVHDKAASHSADGHVERSVSGRLSPKQDRELQAATLLVERLNRDGAKWGQPWSCDASRAKTGEHEDGVDCCSSDPEGSRLNMQVVTPETNETGLWKELQTKGSARRSDPDESPTHDAIMAAIRSKETLTGQERITLVLDAHDAVHYAFRNVVTKFREKYRTQLELLGWQSIWIVGPTVDLVHRLDR